MFDPATLYYVFLIAVIYLLIIIYTEIETKTKVDSATGKISMNMWGFGVWVSLFYLLGYGVYNKGSLEARRVGYPVA